MRGNFDSLSILPPRSSHLLQDNSGVVVGSKALYCVQYWFILYFWTGNARPFHFFWNPTVSFPFAQTKVGLHNVTTQCYWMSISLHNLRTMTCESAMMGRGIGGPYRALFFPFANALVLLNKRCAAIARAHLWLKRPGFPCEYSLVRQWNKINQNNLRACQDRQRWRLENHPCWDRAEEHGLFRCTRPAIRSRDM